MNPLLEQLLSAAPVITDGAWGTLLQEDGEQNGEFPDAWNLSQPDRVEKVPRVYVESGSQIVLTNTFRSNRLALSSAGLADKVQELNRAGAAISVRAAAGLALVFGSIGPSGKMILTGQTTAEELRDVFSEQCQALAEGGVDGLVIETMSDIEEAKAALAAAKKTGLPVVVCMVFDSGQNLDRTMMGTTVVQVAEQLTDAGADVIGANCGQGIASYVQIARKLRAATDLPLWIKANAGIPQMDGGDIVYETSAEQFAQFGPDLFNAGASFIGGCCGTTPEFIRELSERLRT